ncbi:MAG TPA: acyltransferase family protein, partial [Chiayiivirga sp.]|nr:acyltransferase family protein [Chiayiivirga sp.]
LWWIKAGPAFPGWQAALPVIATAVLLHAGASGSSWVQRLLSLKPLVFVGLISYSLYLWHWPLFVMVRYRNGMEPLAPAVSFLLCGVAILLAAASYRWVETPLRRKTSRASGVSWRTVLATALSSTLALAIGAHIVKIDHGRQSRFSKEIIKFDNYRNPVIPFVECQGNVHFKRYDPCVVGDVNSDRRILLWGDSYAMAWVPAFDVLGKIHSFAVDTAILSSCPGLVGIDISGGHGCKSFNEKIVEYLSGLQGHSYEAIVLIGSWGPYLDSASGIFLDGQLDEQAKASVFSMGLRNSISIIAASGAKPIIIGPTPGAPGDVPYRIAAAMAFNFKLPQGKSIREVDAYDSRFWSIANKFKSMQALTLVDPSPWFIAGNEYLFKSEQDGLLYRDSGHLSLAGANFVARQFPVNIIPNAMSITTQHGPKP